MPFQVFCDLGQNEQNELKEKVVNHLATTKWLTRTSAHPLQI